MEDDSLLRGSKKGFNADFDDDEFEDCCPCCSPITQRAWVGWSCAFLGCAILEFVGIYSYYHYSVGLAALTSMTMYILLTFVSINALNSLPYKDYAGQNFLYATLIFVAFLCGLFGAVAGGFHFKPYFNMYYGDTYQGVSPIGDALQLSNAVIIEFAPNSELRTEWTGKAEFTSNSEHHWDSWAACVTPIVAGGVTEPGRGATIHFWAVTEGEEDCEPMTCTLPECKGLVLADGAMLTNHARDAARAVVNTQMLEEDPNALFVMLSLRPLSFERERLMLALVGCLVPLLCFPLLAWPLYIVMASYTGRGASLCTGVDTKKKRRRVNNGERGRRGRSGQGRV